MTGHDQQFLIQQAKDGDHQAFAALVEHYWEPVYRWLYGLSGSTRTAEDLTQEAFLKAWKGLGKFEGGAGFRAWLFRIARNALIDDTRKIKESLDFGLVEATAVQEEGPLHLLLQREREDLLEQAIAQLPEPLRQAFLLRCQQSMSYAEIAEVLTAKEDTARWWVYKARRLLLRNLAAYSNLEELPS